MEHLSRSGILILELNAPIGVTGCHLNVSRNIAWTYSSVLYTCLQSLAAVAGQRHGLFLRVYDGELPGGSS